MKPIVTSLLILLHLDASSYAADKVFLVENRDVQGACLSSRTTGLDSRDETALRQFCELDQDSTESDIAASLNALRVSNAGDDAGSAITSRLRENDPLFLGRGPKEVVRLRGYMLASLGSVGAPNEAVPYLIAELKHADQRVPYLVAACARAARGLHSNQELLVPLLIRYLDPREPDDVVDLDNYNAWPPEAPTSVKTEVLKTLIGFGSKSTAALEELVRVRELASFDYTVYRRNPALGELLEQAIAGIAPRPGPESTERPTEIAVMEAWLEPAARTRSEGLDSVLIDGHGKRTALQLHMGKPFAVTFFYSRCDNMKKCSMTISRLAALQRRLENERLLDRMSLFAVSLDPSYDTPQKMKSFAEARRMRLDEHSQLLKAETLQDHARLMAGLDVAVSYNANQVGFHGIELLLFDRRGRYVRRYSQTHWNTEHLIGDLRTLISESPE